MNTANIYIERESLEGVFKRLGVKYAKFTTEDVYVDNIELSAKFKQFIFPLSSEIQEVHYDITNVKKYMVNKEFELFETCLGDLRMNVKWLKRFPSLFKYVIADVLPRIKKNEESIYPGINTLFDWTFFTHPRKIKAIFLTQHLYAESIDELTNIGFAINPKNKATQLLKSIFNKMNAQLEHKQSFLEWFNKGNFYQYLSDVLFLNISLTVGYKDIYSRNPYDKYVIHNKYWSTFTQKLLKELCAINNDPLVVCFGSAAKKLVEKIKLSNVIFDFNPLARNKPHNYMTHPNYFYLLRDIFEK